MKQQLVTMLALQDRMNKKVHPEWQQQGYEWYRAIWIECAELMDHYGYKWWKKQQADMPQVQLEVIDIWHFGLSALFDRAASYEEIAAVILAELEGWQGSGSNVHHATEVLAEHALAEKTISIPAFWELLSASDLDFTELFRQYVGKNVLNIFRQDNGYKEGTYIKVWDGREDNEHLFELMSSLDASNPEFASQLQELLQQRYQSLSTA